MNNNARQSWTPVQAVKRLTLCNHSSDRILTALDELCILTPEGSLFDDLQKRDEQTLIVNVTDDERAI